MLLFLSLWTFAESKDTKTQSQLIKAQNYIVRYSCSCLSHSTHGLIFMLIKSVVDST